MSELILNLDSTVGKIKPMHSVNNGPSKGRSDQTRSNFDTFKDAHIPLARTHDASFCSAYGGEHTVDVHMIFPNFDADENDPASYDFDLTDEYMQTILDAGTKVFYRLGSKIEHESKKYGTLPPKDFAKWARICEHIIRHMNEGWSNCHHFGNEYWEFWNESDLSDTDKAKKTWGGTTEQFFDLYTVTAKYLKSCFPNLKIGGPSLAYRFDGFMRPFLAHLRENDVPLDFFSWHSYSVNVGVITENAAIVRRILDEYGYTEAESILNEWNYVENWSSLWTRSLCEIQSLHGAAFIAATMCACQNSSIDHLMYYDARLNTSMNGMFSQITLRPLKGYYPFKMFSKLYELENQLSVENNTPNVYCTAARKDGNFAAMIAYYSPDKNADCTTFTLEVRGIAPDAELKCYLVDEDRVMTPVPNVVLHDGRVEMTLTPDSFLLLEN